MSDDVRETGEAGHAILSMFRRGAEFTKQLLEENERLRNQLGAFEQRQNRAARNPEDWENLRHDLLERIERLEDENRSILEQLRAVESENHHFAERYVEIEEENNSLANLYVASYQLHSTLNPSEVLKVILEIVINLVGAEVFCVYVFDEKSELLEPVAAEGRPTPDFPTLSLDQGSVGRAVQRGDVESRDPSDRVAEPAEGGDPMVSIPLRVVDRPVGAIAIYSLLQQKEGFSELDFELFRLLAGHAATAIFASRLYSESERKLNTIQGFIDLLTK